MGFGRPFLREGLGLGLFSVKGREEAGKMSTFLQKVVKNDAMKSDPPEIYNWRVYVLTCSVGLLRIFAGLWLTLTKACFGGALFGVDVGIIGGVLKLPPFMKYTSLWPRSIFNS